VNVPEQFARSNYQKINQSTRQKAVRQLADGFLYFTISSNKEKLNPAQQKILIKKLHLYPLLQLNLQQSKSS
jgi:hypothetical protein